jgi:hypothetical protein
MILHSRITYEDKCKNSGNIIVKDKTTTIQEYRVYEGRAPLIHDLGNRRA